MKVEVFNWGGFPGQYIPDGTMPDMRKLQAVATRMRSEGCFGVQVHPTLGRADFLFAQPLEGLGIELDPGTWARLTSLKPTFIGYAPRHPDVISTMQPLSLIWDQTATQEYKDSQDRKVERGRAWEEVARKNNKQLIGEVASTRLLPQNVSDDEQSIPEGDFDLTDLPEGVVAIRLDRTGPAELESVIADAVGESVQHVDGHILTSASSVGWDRVATLCRNYLGDPEHTDLEPVSAGGGSGRSGGCEETSAETGGVED